MRTVGWNVVIVSLAYLASGKREKTNNLGRFWLFNGFKLMLFFFFLNQKAAELPKKCSAPPEYPHTTLVKKYRSRKIFNAGEKIYYNCAKDFTPSKGFRAVQCSGGKWTKLTLKCESE